MGPVMAMSDLNVSPVGKAGQQFFTNPANQNMQSYHNQSTLNPSLETYK